MVAKNLRSAATRQVRIMLRMYLYVRSVVPRRYMYAMYMYAIYMYAMYMYVYVRSVVPRRRPGCACRGELYRVGQTFNLEGNCQPVLTTTPHRRLVVHRFAAYQHEVVLYSIV